jgi:type IV secretory pathway VirB2 component (pilin)
MLSARPQQDYEGMGNISNLLPAAALVAVALVLLMGLANMLRGGSPNLSQTLMRWRVGLQLVALIVIMTVLFLRR